MKVFLTGSPSGLTKEIKHQHNLVPTLNDVNNCSLNIIFQIACHNIAFSNFQQGMLISAFTQLSFQLQSLDLVSNSQ